MRRPALRAAGIAAALVLALILFLVAGLPPLARQFAEREGSAWLQRPLTIESIHFNPFTLRVEVRGLAIGAPGATAPGDAPEAGFARLVVDTTLGTLLGGVPRIEALTLEAPRLRLVRTAPGEGNWSDLAARLAGGPEPAEPARFAVHNIRITDGALEIADAVQGTRHAIRALRLDLPFLSNLPDHLETWVEPRLELTVDGAALAFTGHSQPFSDDRESTLTLRADGLDLARYLAYLPAALPVALRSGTLDGELTAHFVQPPGAAPRLRLSGRLALAGVDLRTADDAPLARLGALQAELADSEPLAGRLHLTRIAATGVDLALHRAPGGGLSGTGAGGPPPPAHPAPATATAARPLALRVDALELGIDALRYRDPEHGVEGELGALALQAGPLTLERAAGGVSEIRLAAAHATVARASGAASGAAAHWHGALDELALDTDALALTLPAGGAPHWRLDGGSLRIARYAGGDRTRKPAFAVSGDALHLRVEALASAAGPGGRIAFASGFAGKGRLTAEGELSVSPPAARLDLALDGLDLVPWMPLVAHALPADLRRGHLHAKGRLSVAGASGDEAGWHIGYRGGLGVDQLSLRDRHTDNNLLRWRSLAVRGIEAESHPPRLTVDEIALTDFSTGLLLDEQGRLNLRALRGDGPALGAADGAPAGDAAPVPRAAEAPVTAPAAPPFALDIRRIRLAQGSLQFTDRFIQPNYRVRLGDLGGALDGLSTDAGREAVVDLVASVDRTAPVRIAGRFAVLRADPMLDISASLRDFELTGLSSYSAKYVGYGIEKGKFSAELTYRIADRKLTASNQILLDQLTFGDRVDSPEATTLPVAFLVSLLKNGRGEIDINLPVSGSLDDPEFSLGGIILKVIGNLLAKAVASPFTLLASAFGGGGEELSRLEFAPGNARLPETALPALERLAAALADRPGLKLEITGHADPAADAEGLRQARLQRRVLAQREGGGAGRELAPGEYEPLLRRLYRASELPDRPRNAIGLLKDLPVAEMEARLLGAITIREDDLRDLALSRAQAAKAWLIGPGRIASERVYVRAPSAREQEAAPGVARHRVDFSLR